MKKSLLFLFVFAFLVTKAQLPSLTFTNVTGSNSITCSSPTINVLASVNNYTNGTLTYTWVGLSASLSGTNVNINSPDNYTVTAYNTANSFSITQVFSIGINTTIPTSTLTPLSVSITCTPSSSATFTGQTTSSNVTQSWYSPFSYAVATNTAVTAIYNTTAPGTGTYCVKSNVSGCSTCKTFTISSNSGFPTYTVSSPNQFSVGCGTSSLTTIDILNVTTNPAPGGPVSYTILPPGFVGSFTVGGPAIYSVSTQGTYTVVVQDNTNNCVSQVPVTIIQNTVAPTINFSALDYTLTCYSPTVVLQGSTTSTNASYAWSFPGPGSATTNTVLVSTTAFPTNTLIGNYSLNVTTNSNACSSTSVISFYQNTAAPTPSIAGPNTAPCNAPTVTFTNVSISNVPAIYFPTMPAIGHKWYGPVPQASLSNSQTYTASTAGVYTLVVLDLNNGCTSIANKTLVLTGVPQISSPAPFNINCPTPTVMIYPTVTSATAGLTYSWSVPATASVSGLTTQTITTNSPGIYTVTVTGSISSCSSTTLVNVAVCAGVNENYNASNFISIFPNPASDRLNIQFTSDEKEFAKAQIVNSMGQVVKEVDLNNNTQINIADLPDGVYLLNLKSANSSGVCKRIVVAR